jgi:IS605 OrfB family transposase
MQQNLIVKVQLYPSSKEALILQSTMNAYMQACDWLSTRAFNKSVYKAKELQKLYYQTLRSEFGLKAQMAISVTRTVSAKYKTVNEQLKSKPARYDQYTFKRNLEWLQKPICFKKRFVDLVRERDWSFKQNAISLNTLQGRIEIAYNVHTNRGLLNKDWHFGTGTIHKIRNKWYFYIPVSIDIPDCTAFNNVVGIDRGIKNVIYTYDGTGKSTAVNGEILQAKRQKFKRTRKSLQSKNTKGAKRLLKRIAGRENRWMNDVNHCLSKTLVNAYEANTAFVLEDLSKISYKTHKSKDLNYNISSWAFYDFEQKLIYKAQLKQDKVIYVNPHNTSIQCPLCGHVDKNARDRKASLYTCKECGFAANDDLVGAMNIYQRGIAQLST